MKPKTIKKIKESTEEYMKKLGTYKIEYDMTIQIYAETVHAYQSAYAQFDKDGKQFVVDGKKNPYLTAITELRRDISKLSNELMLTPRTNETIVQEQTYSDPAEKTISNLDNELQRELEYS